MADHFSEDLLDDDPDRRGNERIHFEDTFQITSDELKNPEFVIGDDISPGGMKFFCRKTVFDALLSDESRQLLQEGEKLTEGGALTILLSEDLRLHSEIRLISEGDTDTGGWDVGKNIPIAREKMEGYQVCVEFVGLTDHQQNALSDYIQNLPEEDALAF